jgi:beta-phosphoglucomutase-like phosphatase (HAD superfamily)
MTLPTIAPAACPIRVCWWRRPSKWRLNLEQCFVISDKWQDAEAARAVGAISLLLQSPSNGKERSDLVLPDLAAAVERLLRLRTSKPLLAA